MLLTRRTSQGAGGIDNSLLEHEQRFCLALDIACGAHRFGGSKRLQSEASRRRADLEIVRRTRNASLRFVEVSAKALAFLVGEEEVVHDAAVGLGTSDDQLLVRRRADGPQLATGFRQRLSESLHMQLRTGEAPLHDQLVRLRRRESSLRRGNAEIGIGNFLCRPVAILIGSDNCDVQVEVSALTLGKSAGG